jgi:PEGA domain-containing protein
VPIEPEPDDHLIAAAEAAASWARARRAKWTDRPLPKAVETVPADEPFEFEFEEQPAPPPPPPTPPPARPEPPRAPVTFEPHVEFEPAVKFEPQVAFEAPAPPPVAPPRPPAPARARKMPALGEPIKRWAPRLAAAAALVAVAAAIAPYAMSALSNMKTRATAVPEKTPEPSPAAPRKPMGTLSVTTTPPGAQVTIDGKPRGVTPLDLTDVSPGKHEVALKSDAGSVRRTITMAAGKTVTIDEAIFAGWLAVYSPFEVTISEGGRVLRPDDRNQVMMAPGGHDLRFVNNALGFDVSRQIEVKPGEGATVRLTPEPSKLSVTATDAAEVFVDGTRIGEVPLTNAPVALGTHEVVVRRTADGTERRSTITVGVAPFALHVDFSRPGD